MTGNTATIELTLPRVAAKAGRPGTWLAAALVLVFASWLTFSDLANEPHFADESAMIAQSYYWTLFKNGQWNHADWLHYAAYDHPPLPKYMFGLFLDLAGKPVPQSIDWWMNWSGYERVDGLWVPSPRGGDFSPPREPGVLYWARVPSALFGVAGALAAFAIGIQLRGRMFGVIAAMLVIVDPLYLTHARRAMSDSFTECLVLASVAAGLWGARLVWSNEFRWRGWLLASVAASVTCGLAALAKLNGGIATAFVLAILSGNWLLAVWVRTRRIRTAESPSMLGVSIAQLVIVAIGLSSFSLFVLLNPLMVAKPRPGPRTAWHETQLESASVLTRARFLIEFRRDWSRKALANPAFQDDWLETIPQRIQMTLCEGFGRYAMFGPRDIRTVTIKGFDRDPRDGRLSAAELPRWLRGRIRRMDANSDGFVDERELTSYLRDTGPLSLYGRRTSLAVFPLFVWGLCCLARGGWLAFRSGTGPLAWGIILYAAAVLAIVVFMIPLNWDRYYLPLQPCAALVVPYGLASALDWVRSRLVLKPQKS